MKISIDIKLNLTKLLGTIIIISGIISGFIFRKFDVMTDSFMYGVFLIAGRNLTDILHKKEVKKIDIV